MSATLTMESSKPIFGFNLKDAGESQHYPLYPPGASCPSAQPQMVATSLNLPPLYAKPKPAMVFPQQLVAPSVPRVGQLPDRSVEQAPPAVASSLPGWTGLLAISRNSGASGVLGSQPPADDEPAHSTKIEVCCTAHTNDNVRRLMKSVIRGLKACQEPEKAKEGMGGTYFFTNEYGRKVAILKPCDEEPLAPNNPKGYVGRSLGEPGWKPTVRVGEAAMREVAAYLLDHDGWAKVPTSVLVRARHPIFCYNSRMSSVRQSSLDLASAASAAQQAQQHASVSMDVSGSDGFGRANLPMKLGSLQEFVTHMCDTSEMGPSKFSARDVHRIGIFDIRLFNTDRHAGNMLVRESRRDRGSSANLLGLGKAGPISIAVSGCDSQYELIPIDHGFCLPETLEACYFEWLHWPQAMLPFTQEELLYIAGLDIEADKELLRKELPSLRPECLRVMEVATTLLQLCAAAGLTLFEIASVMTRPYEGGSGEEEPSQLERTVAGALAEAMQELDDECECNETIAEADSEDADTEDEDAGLGTHAEEEEEGEEGGLPFTPLLKHPSSNGEDGIFDLDEDPRTPHHKAGPHSSGSTSLGSSLSSSGGDFSFGLASSALGSGTPGLDSASTLGTEATAQDGPRNRGIPLPQLASSVHVTDGGFLWRRMKGGSGKAATAKHARSGSAHKRSPAGGRKAGAMRRAGLGICSPQAYPPPVVAFAPDSLNGLFSDIDDAQWARFMHVYRERLNDALEQGIWKQDLAKDASVAMSCPRF